MFLVVCTHYISRTTVGLALSIHLLVTLFQIFPGTRIFTLQLLSVKHLFSCVFVFIFKSIQFVSISRLTECWIMFPCVCVLLSSPTLICHYVGWLMEPVSGYIQYNFVQTLDLIYYIAFVFCNRKIVPSCHKDDSTWWNF